jgi:hypothetical protein
MMLTNRDNEMAMVQEALDDLTGEERLIQTPIVNFCGIPGIGKTTVLLEVIRLCQTKNIPCITTLKNVEDESLGKIYSKDSLEAIREAIDAQESHRDPFVVVIDDTDDADRRQMKRLEQLLSFMIEYQNLFIVLASRRKISFEHQKKIMRNMEVRPLPPLNWASSRQLLDTIAPTASEEQKELIYRWTLGYPLAMEEMVAALASGLDSSSEQGRRELMQRVVDRVIVRGLLADVEEQERFHALLRLLAFPRRFNLVLMRSLIERFEERYRFSSILAYMTVPRDLTETTGVLDWNLAKAGFIIEEPVRTILLLEARIGDEARFREINAFLAEKNWEYALEVWGEDRILYLLEFLYHRFLSVEHPETLLQPSVEQIMEQAELSTELLVSFRSVLAEDGELLETLGTSAPMLLNLVYERLTQHFFDLYEQEEDRELQAEMLSHAFVSQSLVIGKEDLAATIKMRIEELVRRESPAWVLALYERLSANEKFRVAVREFNDSILETLRSLANEEE